MFLSAKVLWAQSFSVNSALYGGTSDEVPLSVCGRGRFGGGEAPDSVGGGTPEACLFAASPQTFAPTPPPAQTPHNPASRIDTFIILKYNKVITKKEKAL